jgi:pimeloyl-ACP methyl ester carboxylesterase
MASPSLVFLHGWAGSSTSWIPITERLKSQFPVFTPNLPYPKNKTLTLNDYCQSVLEFLKSHKIKKPVLIGHSLGGAIATQIASNYPSLPQAIILLSSASIRHQLPQPWRFLQPLISPFNNILRPFRHQLLKLAHLDASDYETLNTKIEKDTFRHLIHHDQSSSLSKISCPALILWGDQDISTPLSDGQKIHSLIKNSVIKTFPNSGHFFYLDYQQEVAQAITDFIKK